MDTQDADPFTYTVGYRLNSSWAVQLEYSEASPFRGRVKSDDDGQVPCNIEYTTTAGYLMVIHPMGSLLDLNMKYGYVQVDYSFSDPSVEHAAKKRYAFADTAYGGGLTLKMSKAVVFTVDYTQLREDASQISAGVELNL